MNQIESGARKRHGDFLYDLTWKARKGDNKWLWAAVAAVALLRLIWRPVAFAAIAYAVVGLNEGFLFQEGMKVGFWIVIAVAMLGAPIFEALFLKSHAFGHTSNFIAIAGDMLRVSTASKNRFGRMIAKMSYLAAGALALYCALAIYWFNRKRLLTLSVTELDVLGNALSKGGFWKAAKAIFHVLHAHFGTQSLGPVQKAQQAAVSYALACKWMMRKPRTDRAEKEFYLAMIQHIMEKYQLPEEVTMRLKEALG